MPVLPINKLCHKVSCISRPSEEAASREAKIKVVTKHNFSKFLGLFRLIKVVTTIKVVTAKVQPEKNYRKDPVLKPQKNYDGIFLGRGNRCERSWLGAPYKSLGWAWISLRYILEGLLLFRAQTRQPD